MQTNRREFLATAVGGVSWAALSAHPLIAQSTSRPKRNPALARKIGITTSSIDAHVSPMGDDPDKIALYDLPKLLSDKLDMHVIDLNTRTLGSADLAHAERFRKAVEQAGSTVTNLKLNQRELDLGSKDPALRRKTIAQYKKDMDAAEVIGIPWVRPRPSAQVPDIPALVDGYHELIDYGEPKKIGLLVENYLWLETHPQTAFQLVRDIGRGVAATPDIGNWVNDDVRYAALKVLFPVAVSCDFKARQLGPNGEHEEWDLKRCFQTGWDAGFRGPWCFEHTHADQEQLIRELALLRDMLNGWMNAADA